MKCLPILIFLCLLNIPHPAHAAEKTLIRDKAEATKLLGRHLFTSPWISGKSVDAYEVFGVAEVTNEQGVYKFSAEHENYYEFYEDVRWDDGGYIRLNGTISEIKEKQFYLDGVLEYYKYNQNIYGDMHCRKEGLFLFASNGHPAYWRLQWGDGTGLIGKGFECTVENAPIGYKKHMNDGYIIVDIFTAPLEGEPPSGRKVKRPNPVK